MAIRTVAITAAALEAVVGSAMIAAPTFLIHLLLGASLASSGIAVARLGGCGLLSLGLATWPSRDYVTTRAASALFTYNLLAALYIGYLGLVVSFHGYLLWPACALHALLTLLLARPAYRAVREKRPLVPLSESGLKVADDVAIKIRGS